MYHQYRADRKSCHFSNDKRPSWLLRCQTRQWEVAAARLWKAGINNRANKYRSSSTRASRSSYKVGLKISRSPAWMWHGSSSTDPLAARLWICAQSVPTHSPRPSMCYITLITAPSQGWSEAPAAAFWSRVGLKGSAGGSQTDGVLIIAISHTVW